MKIFFTKKYIGLDIGLENIKIAHLKKYKEKWVVDDLSKVNNPIKTTIFSNDTEKEIIINLLKQKIGHGYKNIVVGIPTNYTILRNLKLPKLKSRELDEAIYWASQEISPMFNSEFISSYEVTHEANNNLHILFAAAKKTIILNYIEIVDKLGLNLVALDIYPLAGARLLSKIDSKNIIALIDIGKLYSLVNVIEKGKVFFCRQIPLGSFNITKKLAEELQISNIEAEHLKKNPQNYKDTITDIIEPIISKFTVEILNVFNLYSAQNREKRVDYVIFIGNGSKLWCLKDILRNLLHTKIVMPDEIRSFIPTRKRNWNWDYYDFANAIGFAMRG